MTIEVFDVRDEERLSEAIALRFEVFVAEQGVPAEIEVDDHDRTDLAALHALARDGERRPLGTARLYAQTPQTARIGRMAVRSDARGNGIGAAFLERLLAEARAREFVEIVLDAQVHAIGFYERSGFAVWGEPFDEAGIPHQPMRRHLLQRSPPA